MNKEKIIRMANQISSFFKSKKYETSPLEIANHINNFWEPRMRKILLEMIEKKYPGIDNCVLKASSLIRYTKKEQ